MSSGRTSVLIIDDDPAQGASLCGLVENLGYEPLAVTAAQAARTLGERRFGAVLIDARTPALDELVRRLRRDDGGSRRTPAIGVAESSAEQALARCLAAGMDDCIAKPFRMKDLAERLLRWIDGRDEATASAKEPVLDAEMIATLRQFDLLKQLVPIYLAALPGLITSLHEALASGDRTAIRQRAHHLRSSSVQMGAAALARVLGEIETKVVVQADGGLDAAAGALDDLARATAEALTRETAEP